ncbi:MAG: alpha/beta hydrolase domain-containing protein [Rhodospirillales bacterium]|nr:alpha/beta hydrolase domain-containing protein [Rhodospirillales bacterium]
MSNGIAIDIHQRTAFAGGCAFGEAGSYERLVGRARFAVDPDAPAQAGIVDLDKAPRNRDGLIEFAADLCILKPADPARTNGRLFFDYGNRGNKRAVQYFCDAPGCNDPMTLEHAGNGYLFRRGYTVVWGAWQGDLLRGDGRMVMDLPVATDGAAPLTGPVRTEFIVAQEGQTTLPLSGWVSTRSHPTVSRDPSKARLTRRRYPEDERVEIAPDAWQFARLETGLGLDFQGGEQAIVESDAHIYMPGGFEPGWIYELVYEARDPLVLGLGYVAVRDLVSFLKHEDCDSEGRANPVAGAGPMEKAYAFGRSQTGRLIRDAIYRGFNADAIGRKVFDGVLTHVAGCGRMWMNHRFANVVVPAGQQYEDHDNAADSFPFSYAACTDHLTGKTDAICKRSESDPLIFHTQSATEYWQRRGSLVHTDTRGNDLEQPAGVRVYFWSSAPHVADPNQGAPVRGICQNLSNVVQTSMLFRALLDAMDRWASDGIAPPPSRIPSRSDGSLVGMEEWRKQFPSVPGIAIPREPSALPLYDFGPEAEDGIQSTLPPEVVDPDGYTVLVPAVDADGNDVAGVRVPMVAAPLATCTGWNLRGRGHGVGAMHEFTGSTIPLPETESMRAATGDPRPSIEQRYGDAEGYVATIVEAAQRLVADGLMLEEDIARVEERARTWSRPLHDVRL